MAVVDSVMLQSWNKQFFDNHENLGIRILWGGRGHAVMFQVPNSNSISYDLGVKVFEDFFFKGSVTHSLNHDTVCNTV